MIRASAIAALVLLSVSPVLAQPPAPPRPQEPPCLRQRNIYSFDAVPGNRALIVTDIARKRYRVNFMGVCPGLQFDIGLAFQSRGVGTLACVQRGDVVHQRDPVGSGQCIVRDVEYQTPVLDRADAEEAARRKAR